MRLNQNRASTLSVRNCLAADHGLSNPKTKSAWGTYRNGGFRQIKILSIPVNAVSIMLK